jgi:hypothetical protein
MRPSGWKYFSAALAVIVMLSLATSAFPASQPDCDALRKEMESKQGELNSYLDALGRSRTQQDSMLSGALNHKIDQLITQIALLEERLARCGDQQETIEGQGLSSVKSEEGKFATKTCGELRKILVQLHRKVNSFKRRENSLLSDLTSAEKNELKESVQNLETVRKLLNTRCADGTNSDSLKKKLR